MNLADPDEGGDGRRKRVMRRIPSSEWEPLKLEIKNLYETNTQEQVVNHLNDVRKFRVTRRQLINQLKKWKFFKYTTKVLQGGVIVAAANRGGFGVEHQMATDGTDEVVHRAWKILTLANMGKAAEVHFAILDDKVACLLSMNLCAAPSRRDRLIGVLDSTTLVLSRSAQTQDQTTEAQHILDRILQTAKSAGDHPTALKCCLLKANMQARTGDIANEALDMSDPDLQHLERNPEGLDFLAFHLRRVLSDYAELAGPLSSFSNDGYSVLQSCISWSAVQLETLFNLPVQLTMLDGDVDAEVDKWREETELLLALWHRGQMSHWNEIEWVKESETKLGITATELLATVISMIMEVSGEMPDDIDNDDDEFGVENIGYAYSFTTKDDQEESEDGESYEEQLLECARDGARAIEGWDKFQTYEVFSGNFDRRNTPTEPSDGMGAPACMIEALKCVGKFIADTLAVEGTGV
ncbi:hypothetical protein VP1G_07541 [Cytospora mali]|uniref:Clr5 domain-containing protein n=1 Tax=Cytospora mali TaxID=578113 RepID=A0A194V8X9_CYTMA|nr:hypothetical protein VP1G_07541 [Valsa mali var. pyri (nom. inval.)]